MSLWVKRTGQLLVAVLFLMSCEDESFLLGFRNQNKKINIKYQEFKFSGDQTSVLLLDSIFTDHDHNDVNATNRFLIGQYINQSNFPHKCGNAQNRFVRLFNAFQQF